MRRINRLTVLGLPALLALAACENNTAPELGLEGNLTAEQMEELNPSVDVQLTGALIEDMRFALETEAATQSVLVSDAEQAFADAASAYAAGDVGMAQQKADEALNSLGTAWVDALGDTGLDELFERAYHLLEWAAGENDCAVDQERLVGAIERLIAQANTAVENGHPRRAAARLMLVGQLVDRACFDRDHDGDNFNGVARFAVARAHASIVLAKRLVPAFNDGATDVASDAQNRMLRRAAHLAEWAEKAYQNGRFRRAFALARRAEIMALRAVIDRDGVQDEEIRLVHDVAETLLEEAAAIEDPTEVQQRLVNIADKLFARGVEKLEAGNVRGIVCLWRSAITSMLAL